MKLSDLIDWYKGRIKAVGKAYDELWDMKFNRTLTLAIGKIPFDDNGDEVVLPQDL